MSKTKLPEDSEYDKLLSQISVIYLKGRELAVNAVNRHITETYWQVGEHIIEFEQDGKRRAEYGSKLLRRLAQDLSLLHGKGFSLSNLKRMRQFYLEYPKGATLSHLLSWSHYIELLKIDDELERSFYEQQSSIEHWSIRELIRQKKASLFLRLAASKNKNEILRLAKQGQINMYMGYFENEENTSGDNPPIGIVLAREKDQLLVKYAMNNISSQLFVSKYQLYLPKREELKALIERQLMTE